jgi:hypothetical protein
MKISTIIFLIFVIGLGKVSAQKPYQIIHDKDSTLGMYLNSRIEKHLNNYRDSCFEGFCSIAFSLDKNGVMTAFTTSKTLPQKYVDTIKSLIMSLKPLWEKDFLKTVSKNHAVIIQPIYLFIRENCRSNYKIRSRSQSDTSALSEMTENSDFWESSFIEKTKLVATFPTIYDFTNDTVDLRNSYLLPPVTIMRYSPGNRRKIDNIYDLHDKKTQ